MSNNPPYLSNSLPSPQRRLGLAERAKEKYILIPCVLARAQLPRLPAGQQLLAGLPADWERDAQRCHVQQLPVVASALSLLRVGILWRPPGCWESWNRVLVLFSVWQRVSQVEESRQYICPDLYISIRHTKQLYIRFSHLSEHSCRTMTINWCATGFYSESQLERLTLTTFLSLTMGMSIIGRMLECAHSLPVLCSFTISTQ